MIRRFPPARCWGMIVLLASLLLANGAALLFGRLGERLSEHSALLWLVTRDEVLLGATVLLLAGWSIKVVVDRIGARRFAVLLAEREAGEQEVRRLALCDPLTELLNRRGLEKFFVRPVPDGEGRAVVLCDLDGFKHVNDTLGHAAGDDILRRFAGQLTSLHVVGVDAQYVRLGGDEFVILLTTRDVVGCAVRMAQTIAAMTEQADANWPVSVSIGIAQAGPAARLDDVLAAADTAMYGAKRGGDTFRVFEADGPTREPSRMFERRSVATPVEGRSFFIAALGVNDHRRIRRTHGNGVCGKLMRDLTQRLEQLDVLAVERMAPDTLGILIEAADSEAAVNQLDDLRRRLATRVDMAGGTFDVLLTTGIAGPACRTTLRDRAELAQSALDEAWRTGKTTVVYDAEKQAELIVNRKLMKDLNEAVSAGCLQVYYQPKLCSRTNQIDSLEALVRWMHPIQGMISPAKFVTIAEETGNIRALTDWVVDRVAADQAAMTKEGVLRPVYVNISAQLICEADFVKALLARITTATVQIGIEITETAVLTDPERALRHLNDLSAAGISIAIDDYGVGLSSLVYLKQLPAKELKIDMMFISDLAESHRDPMIVRSTIDLAHGLGLRVTAEGVDNPMSLGLLKVMGCDLLQGFEIARPMPLDDLIVYLHNKQANKSDRIISKISEDLFQLHSIN